MTDILHRVIIETSPEKLYKALTEQRGLSAWWTKAETTAKVGALASFGFGPNGDHKVDMKITELVPNERVAWSSPSGCVNIQNCTPHGVLFGRNYPQTELM